MSRNVQEMREKAKARRSAEAAAQQEAKPDQFKMKRFADVQSKVAPMRTLTPRESLPDGTDGRGSAASSHNGKFLRRGAGKSLATQQKQPTVPPRRTRETQHGSQEAVRKPAVPRRAEVLADTAASAGSSPSKDFLRANAAAAAAMKPKQAEQPKRATERDGYGRVPAYLQARKAVWNEAEAAEAAARADPACPPGMVAMPEEERLDMLHSMQAAHKDVKAQLAGLPLVIETRAAQRRLAALEGRLAELEEAVAMFARPKVYIQPDE